MSNTRPFALIFTVLCTPLMTLVLLAPLLLPFDPPAAAFVPDRPAGLIRLLLLVTWLALSGQAAWRCYAALVRVEAGMPRSVTCAPEALMLAHLAACLAPVAALALPDQFGPLFPLGCYLFVWLTATSHFAFILAGAQVEAAFRNEPVHTTLLALLHHLGGFAGVFLARRTFRESEAFEKFPTEFPRGILVGLVVAFLLVVYSQVLNFGTLATFRPSTEQHAAPPGGPPDRGVDERPQAPLVNAELLYGHGVPSQKK